MTIAIHIRHLLSFHFLSQYSINEEKGRPLEKAFYSSPFLLRGRVMGRDREMASDAKRNHYYYRSKIKIEYLDQSAKPLILKSYIREAFPRGLRLHSCQRRRKPTLFTGLN